jgi:hypothetical protein
MQRGVFNFVFVQIFVLTYPGISKAQREILSPDSTSYSWFMNNEWDSLIVNRKTLLKAAGNDYYYLRYRIAEAFFRKGDYFRSGTEFKKAVRLNSADTFALNRLSSSYLATGRWLESSATQQKLRKLGASLDNSANQQLVFLSGDFGTRISSESDMAGDIHYFGVAAGFSPFGGWSIVLAGQDIQQSYFYGKSHQQSIYSSLSKSWISGLTVYSTANLVEVKFDPLPNGKRRFFNYQTISGGLMVQQNRWLFENEVSYANFSYENNIQNTASISFVPFGDNRLQLTARHLLRFADTTPGMAINTSITGRFSSNLYWNIGAYLGNTVNVLENRSYLLSNSLDLTNYRTFAGLYWYPLKFMNLFILASYEERNESILGDQYKLSGLIAGIKILPLNVKSSRVFSGLSQNGIPGN